MQLVDTHCHLDFFADTYPDVVNRANNVGVTTIIAPATNAQSSQCLLEMSQSVSDLFVGVGIHPKNVDTEGYWTDYPKAEVDAIDGILAARGTGVLQYAPSASIHRIKAIGECGLDFKGEINEKQQQIQIQLFKQHLDWASRFNLPLIIHNRKANEELIALVGAYYNTPLRGVFHCFSGSKILAKQILDLGFYIGIGGLLTLDTGLQQVVKTIPLEKIILETDAPYLTPKPVRDTKPFPNEPANIPIIAQKLAEIKEVSLEEVSAVTTQNAKVLFSLP